MYKINRNRNSSRSSRHHRHFADVESLPFKVKMTFCKAVPFSDSLSHFSFVLLYYNRLALIAGVLLSLREFTTTSINILIAINAIYSLKKPLSHHTLCTHLHQFEMRIMQISHTGSLYLWLYIHTLSPSLPSMMLIHTEYFRDDSYSILQ